jgi:3-hydroxybutyryl-CoA dehydrogenase
MNEKSKPQCVAVVGQGLLGRGIAACFLRHGFAVVTIDRHEEQLADARQSISQMMDELIERGDASPQVRHEWPQRFTATTNYAGLQECSFVVESVAEDLSVKAEALDAIEARLSPAVVIASNTSAIPITRLQHGRRHPARLVGMHWAAPAHATRFMELIRGEETSEEAMQVAARVARQIGKDVCVCQKDIPGFIVNRIAYAMYREAQHLLGTGVADADTIDRAVRNALGLWATLCGPLRWMDLTGGPELYAKAMQGVLPTLCNADTLSPLLQQLAASGAQGIRNGRGFFNYTPGEAQRWEELYRQHAWRVTEMQNEYFPPKSKDAP